jgi:hypothetical protein
MPATRPRRTRSVTRRTRAPDDRQPSPDEGSPPTTHKPRQPAPSRGDGPKRAREPHPLDGQTTGSMCAPSTRPNLEDPPAATERADFGQMRAPRSGGRTSGMGWKRCAADRPDQLRRSGRADLSGRGGPGLCAFFAAVFAAAVVPLPLARRSAAARLVEVALGNPISALSIASPLLTAFLATLLSISLPPRTAPTFVAVGATDSEQPRDERTSTTTTCRSNIDRRQSSGDGPLLIGGGWRRIRSRGPPRASGP